MTKTLYRSAPSIRKSGPLFERSRIEIDVTNAVDGWWSTCVLGVYRQARRAGVGRHTARWWVWRMLSEPTLPVRTIRCEPIEVAA